MEQMSRKQMEALAKMFDRFALKDQYGYYRFALERNRLAARQVNAIRSTFALFAGLASILAGFMVSTWFDSTGLCGNTVQERAAIDIAQGHPNPVLQVGDLVERLDQQRTDVGQLAAI